jgi:hypothetical protein
MVNINSKVVIRTSMSTLGHAVPHCNASAWRSDTTWTDHDFSTTDIDVNFQFPATACPSSAGPTRRRIARKPVSRALPELAVVGGVVNGLAICAAHPNRPHRVGTWGNLGKGLAGVVAAKEAPAIPANTAQATSAMTALF